LPAFISIRQQDAGDTSIFMAACHAQKRTMRKIGFMIVSTSLAASLPSLLPVQTPTTQQEDLSVPSTPYDLSDLGLESTRRLELEDSLKRRDYKRAETILVEEAARDPKSIRTARLLVLAGGIFFLDGQYLNSVISWKKAEALAPLDDRSRFTLAMAYIRLNRRDWARPELEKLAAAHPRVPLYLYWLARLDYDAREYTAAIVR
jgi:tetratricopeptide (TPR) repeat protein